MSKADTNSPDIDNDSRITLGLLNMVDDNSAASQRSMAGNLGIALGLANAYVKRCVKKGLIKASQAPANRYAYYLTSKGFAEKSRLTAEFLSQSFNLFRHARIEGGELLAICGTRGWKRVALYGAGDLTEIMTLSAGDSPVEMVAVISQDTNASEFAGLPVISDIPGLEDADAIVICDISEPQAAYDNVCGKFPSERVLAPQFLGIRRTSGTKQENSQ